MGHRAGLRTDRLVGRIADVIPTGWEHHHRPTLDGTRTARVTVYAWARQEFDRDLGCSVLKLGPVVVADTPARVQAASAVVGRRGRVESEAVLAMYDYLVTIDTDHETVGKGCAVEVLSVADAEQRPVVGRLLEVGERRTGSLEWEVLLHCTDNLGPVT